jgi:hypothetical protein
MPEPKGYEYQMSDKPPSEVHLPTTRRDVQDFLKTNHPVLIVLAIVAVELARANIITLTP